MLGDPFQRGPRQVQTVEPRIVTFQRCDDPQRLRIVVKPAIGLHQQIQRILARVAEGRVTKVMGQCNRFGDVGVQAQSIRDGARNLRHFNRMRQARAIEVAFVFHKDLRFVLQPAKGRGVNDPVAIPLIAGPKGTFVLGVQTTAGNIGGASAGYCHVQAHFCCFAHINARFSVKQPEQALNNAKKQPFLRCSIRLMTAPLETAYIARHI